MEDKKIDELINKIGDSQNNANLQSLLNSTNQQKFFGPKLEQLTESINKASDSSGFLSKVVIALTLVATFIAGLEVYLNFFNTNAYSNYKTESLTCIINTQKLSDNIPVDLATEYCDRLNSNQKKDS
ncbi:hypothetical protein HF888_05800 [Bermanella marisrubri]|uniref:Dihydrolipoamide acetyltransferase n=1 Tax=Bermanella marisrubri TaxID=207949 RepID=Q1MYF6_9GAMM|nr:hypothetical protein [Bermanella marisrubri]EAT10989.1 dihydrolipoamide acetyltransferase [Oceanobacter sp. RED65] [Bermanella marisrubri]QIZ83766.1 hypothetical protein HF888_05800 [Bermanella marisrubri]